MTAYTSSTRYGPPMSGKFANGDTFVDAAGDEFQFSKSARNQGRWVKVSPEPAVRQVGVNLVNQPAPAAKTTSTTLTAAELLTGIITGAQGAGAAATYTTPTGTQIETALLAIHPGLSNDDSFDFSVVNISTVAAETITLAAGASVTLVGDMTMACIAVGDQSSGRFRCRRTAANTYSIYRIA